MPLFPAFRRNNLTLQEEILPLIARQNIEKDQAKEGETSYLAFILT
ncbi:hypothetical protein [Hugenholtzia roseola]|nr:hypothetical protein [Hugenholtzia roseola]